jgi:hypothetical protein
MPAIWTFLVFAQTMAVSAAIVCALCACAMRFTGGETSAGWGILVPALVIGALYVASYGGQRPGHQQGDTIHHFVDDALQTESTSAQALGNS